jgi:phosphoglycolate phosphatase-like HAD superfamily hydrolase
MYDAVVFDMDGVLLTGYHTNRDVYREAARETLSAFDADADGAGDGTGDADPPSALVDPDDAADGRRVCERYDLPPAAAWAYREGVSTELENRRTDVATADRAGVDAALLARDGEPPAGGPEPELHVESLRDLLDVVGG